MYKQYNNDTTIHWKLLVVLQLGHIFFIYWTTLHFEEFQVQRSEKNKN